MFDIRKTILNNKNNPITDTSTSTSTLIRIDIRKTFLNYDEKYGKILSFFSTKGIVSG